MRVEALLLDVFILEQLQPRRHARLRVEGRAAAAAATARLLLRLRLLLLLHATRV